ncbi:MAG: ABC transporter substrate-binding protein [Candidatus Dormibacteraeota bacterium]|nr:ABC transporter substrate-binding protein [Candidatus Dormibacteraeota bacterium]
MNSSRLGPVLSVAVLVSLLAACGGSSTTSASKPLTGKKVEVAAVWSKDEQKNFEAVLKAFSDKTGATATFTSTGDAIGTVIGSRIASKNPPDVAILPQPGLLHDLAAKGALKELDSDTASLVTQNFGKTWIDLGSANGKFYGVFYKVANKSTVWYNVNAFKQAGVSAPKSMADLTQVLSTLSASGVKPVSVGGADGWTLTDWFENAYLNIAGADNYNKLTTHALKWTDQTVKDTFRALGQVLQDKYVAGGLTGALQTDFPTSVSNIAGNPPKAAIVYEGDFVEGILTGTAKMKPETDFNFFPFPGKTGPSNAAMVGGDVAVRMTDNTAAVELMKYLASPEAFQIWGAKGGITSANKKVDLSIYPDPVAKGAAQALTTAQTVVYDMSDQAPSAFGSTKGSGEWADLQLWLKNPTNIDAACAQLEKDATAAYGS